MSEAIKIEYYLAYKDYYKEAMERYPEYMVLNSIERKILDFSKFDSSHIPFLDRHIDAKLEALIKVYRELQNEK